MKLKIFYQENSKIKTKTIDDANINNFPKNIIQIKQIKQLKDYFTISYSSYDDVVDIFKELNIILNTNLSLSQSIKILMHGNKNNKIQKVLYSIHNALENAQPIYQSLEKYKNYIGSLPILFFQLGEENSDIKSSINALSTILIENQKSRKQFLGALSYPLFLTITLFMSVSIIFNFVVPQFEHIFIQYGNNLPFATKSLLLAKNILEEYYHIVFILIGLIIVSIKYLYMKNSILFDKIIALNIPLISQLYQRFIFYRFFLSLNMLVKSNYKFQIALKNTVFIVKNRYILYKLNQIINNIENGSTISKAFEESQLVDNLTIRLLHTAQETNTLPTILSNITAIYKQRLDDNIKYFSSAIGPIFIFILSIFVLWIILALMLPSLSIGTILN